MIHCPTALIVYPPARAAETSTGCDRAALGHLQGELCPGEMRWGREAQPALSTLLAAGPCCLSPLTSCQRGPEGAAEAPGSARREGGTGRKEHVVVPGMLPGG